MEPVTVVNVGEYEALAEARMEPGAWGYFCSGSDDEVTLRANRAAFERLRLRPRMLTGGGDPALATTAVGTPVSMPILVAPMAYQCLADPEGECATARGTGAAGTVMIVSTLATRSIEEVATAATGPLWLQLYVYKDRAVSASLVRRAEAVGCRALVLTADAPRLGRRERDIRNGFTLPPHLHRANFPSEATPAASATESGIEVHARALLDDTLTWEAIDWLRSITTLPVLVKGILTGEDAALAVEHGAAGIVVSNHGGRQLDGALAGIEALPEVVAAVNGRCEVFVDGGIRRGTDVVKALALGARAVLVGRPVLWGLAARSQAGVEHVLAMLRAELEMAMVLSGQASLASLSPSLVTRV